MKWIGLLIVLATSVNCAGSGPATSSAACDIFKPIYFQDADQMTAATERSIIRHNEVGQKICRWS